MEDDVKNIKCPKCGESISIDDVLTHQIEEKIKKLQTKQKKKYKEEIELDLKILQDDLLNFEAIAYRKTFQ